MTKAARSADVFPDRVSDWDDLAKVIAHFSEFNGHDWLFRGVREEAYALIPNVGRPRIKKSITPKTIPYSQTDELAALRAFKQQARAHLSTSHTPIEWMAIAQHFGVPTRLLDWSDSVLVAAWFAVQDSDEEKSDAAIWVTRGERQLSPDFVGDPFDLTIPCIYRPPHLNARMGAQGSVLMVCPRPVEEVKLVAGRKILITGNQRFHLRKRLNACGMNARAIYGDLGGLGQHLAWLYQNNWLAGYRKID